MDKNAIVCLVACLTLALTARAAEGGEQNTLDSLITVALERNPAIRAAEHKLGAAKHAAKFAGWLPDPKFSAAVLNLPRRSLSFDETPMSGVALGLSQSIPWPGKLAARADIADLNSELRVMDMADLRNSIVRQATHYYYDYSHWTLVETALAKILPLVENISEVARTRYANGDGSLQDALRSETSEGRIANRILMARQMASSALIQLASLTDSPSSSDTPLMANLPPIPAEVVVVPTEWTNPALTRASISSRVAQRKVGLAESASWPDFTIGVDYRIRKDIPMDAVSGEDFLTFKIGLNLPVWFFARQRNQTAAAKQGRLAAQANERAVRNNVQRQVADIVLALQSLSKRAEQYELAILPQAQAAVEAARVAYEVGQVDFNGYLSAHLDAMNVELERLALVKQYHQRSAALRELTTDAQETTK